MSPVLLLLPVVAFLYAMVGHGGASGYLAVMALSDAAPEMIRPTALVLNLAVSLAAFLLFRHGRHFRREILLPLAAASVPFAYLGGLVTIDEKTFRMTLGLLLLIAAGRFALVEDVSPDSLRMPPLSVLLPLGAAIGFLSGMIGIGGGVLLSPILLLMRATTQKETAAISAPFIFVNSLAGLLGQWTIGLALTYATIVPAALAFGGGLVGAWLGALRLPPTALRIVLSVVLAPAAGKLLWVRA